MPETTSNSRTRINMSQTAKGLWQIDVTAEYDTPEQTASALSDAIERARGVAEEKGLQLVSDQ